MYTVYIYAKNRMRANVNENFSLYRYIHIFIIYRHLKAEHEATWYKARALVFVHYIA